VNLYEASCWYFNRSQSALKRGLVLSAVLLILTLTTLWSLSDAEDAFLVVVIGLAQLWLMWSKYRALYWFGKGDEPRRMYQLQVGLGVAPSAERCARIEAEVGVCNQPIDPTYWLSKKTPSPRRMIEMLLESSFYTRSLALKCRNLFMWIGLAGLSLSLITLIVAYRTRTSDRPNALVAHIVITVFVFFLTGDFWIICLLYNDLFKSADDSHKHAYQILQQTEITHDQALEIAMDYNTAVVQAPPLLSSRHLSSKSQLDVLFRRSYSELLGI